MSREEKERTERRQKCRRDREKRRGKEQRSEEENRLEQNRRDKYFVVEKFEPRRTHWQIREFHPSHAPSPQSAVERTQQKLSTLYVQVKICACASVRDIPMLEHTYENTPKNTRLKEHTVSHESMCTVLFRGLVTVNPRPSATTIVTGDRVCTGGVCALVCVCAYDEYVRQCTQMYA